MKLGRQICSEAADVCDSKNLQVIVTDGLSALGLFKQVITPDYALYPRNCN